MKPLRAILPGFVAVASVLLLPETAEAKRLGLFELRFDSVLAPSFATDQAVGSFQFVRLGSAVEPAPLVVAGFDGAVGYFSNAPWPTFVPNRSTLAVGFELFLRRQPEPGPGLRGGAGLSIDGAFAGGNATSRGGSYFAAWLDLLGGIWLSNAQALTFFASPGIAAVNLGGRSGLRPMLRLSAAYQF